MGQLDVHIRHGGGGDLGALLVAAVPAAGIAAAGYFTMKTIAAIPAWVMVAVPVVLVAAAAMGLRALLRHNQRQAAAFTARCEQRRAVEAAEKEGRHQRRIALAAASAPVINNHVWTPEAIEAMHRGYTPTTVIAADAEEISR